jgi:hypothetical protein
MIKKKDLLERIEELENEMILVRKDMRYFEAMIREIIRSLVNVIKINKDQTDVLFSMADEIEKIEKCERLQNTLNACFDEEIQSLRAAHCESEEQDAINAFNADFLDRLEDDVTRLKNSNENLFERIEAIEDAQ